jgi:hypothetical protein
MLRRSQSQERILSRERATPALLRGRRPPPGGGGNSVLVSQQEEEEETTFRQAEVRIPIQRSNGQPRVNEQEEDEIDSFLETREGRRSHEDYGGRGLVSSGYSSNTLPKKLPGSSRSVDPDNDIEDRNSGGKSGGGFKAASDRLFGRKPAADGGSSSSTMPRNFPSREKPSAASKEKEKQPLLTQMRETLAAAVLPRQHNAFMKETRASFRRKSLIQGEAERESSSRPAPLTRTGSLRHAAGSGGGGGGAKEGAGLFGRSSSFRQKKSRIEEDSLAGKSRPVPESGRPLLDSSRSEAESGRPLAESGRPLAESNRRLGTHAGSREKIAATTQDAEGVCTAHGNPL